MSKIFIVGSINMDLVIKSEYMPKNGETVSGSDFMTNPGGKGANQAVAVAKLGGQSYMVGAVGEAFGDELKNTLSGYGVNVDYVNSLKGVSSGIAVIVVVDGDNRIILDAGSNGKVDKALVDKAFESAKEGDYLICQLEISQETVKYALELGKKKGMITLLNPAPAANLIDGILACCDYFIPNQSEAEFYTGIYPDTELSAKACAEKLKTFGVKNIVVTMGGEGSSAVSNGEYVQVPAKKTTPIDTTAAGDTFVGAFTVALSEGKDIKSAMEFATSASAITITRRGAQQSIPTRNELK